MCNPQPVNNQLNRAEALRPSCLLSQRAPEDPFSNPIGSMYGIYGNMM